MLYICSKITIMAVTKLKRKEQRNQSNAKLRVKALKRLKTRVTVKSPLKGESGIVLEDQ